MSHYVPRFFINPSPLRVNACFFIFFLKVYNTAGHGTMNCECTFMKYHSQK